ncbi:MAG: hypothetical protein BGP10_13330 [Rhodanobacter sp. 68-29]|nr:hypothetical protein [Rhodanobacter sp.]ODU92226.1 MAG: hypothetical protein ABT18_13180 [Rhodanobacter sp. SCN 66-43]OJY58307.1 MAG: hypothetical protein BGP10_13330 [Rhodanobacter sp. 68-29]
MTPIYFLDRNALSVIKGHLAGKSIQDSKKLDFLQRLQQLDQKGNHVTPLLAIIEGEHGREETVEEKEQCVVHDTDAVREFFTVARTDADDLANRAHETAQTFALHIESGWDARGNYWAASAPLVKGGVAKNQRRRVEGQLAELAEIHQIGTQDPIHLLMLAALHGSEQSADALKLSSKTGSYNPLSDLHVLSRMALVQAVGIPLGRSVTPTLVTMDEGLEHVLNHTCFIESKILPDESLHMVMSFGHALYPHLSHDEYLALMSRATTSAPNDPDAG